MAKIETTFIRPKEIFNVDDGTAKVVYDGYQNNPHEIELKENLEGDVKAEINAEFVPNDNNNVVFKDSENVEHELITNEGFPTEFNEAFLPALKANQLISTTWQGLKDLRDNGQLIAGSLYRITDYQCTTTQENTRSAGHQFDIVLLALSNNKLAEEGWAMEHPTDVYDVTFADGVTKKCYLNVTSKFTDEAATYENWNVVDVNTMLGVQLDDVVRGVQAIVDDNTKTIVFSSINSSSLIEENLTYNYFQNSKLEAWKVWYCLDNDTARFAWADDASEPQIYQYDLWFIRDENKDAHNKFAWYNEGDENLVFTDSTNPKIGDTLYSYNGDVIEEERPISAVKGFGRGVIYRLIDEFNNDVAYDFKNIQYVRKLTDGQYDSDNGENTWVYTFTNNIDGNIRDASFAYYVEHLGVDVVYAANNYIGPSVDGFYLLTNNVFIGDDVMMDNKLYSNSTGNTCLSNNETIMYNTYDLDNTEGYSIYMQNKKVLTET